MEKQNKKSNEFIENKQFTYLIQNIAGTKEANNLKDLINEWKKIKNDEVKEKEIGDKIADILKTKSNKGDRGTGEKPMSLNAMQEFMSSDANIELLKGLKGKYPQLLNRFINRAIENGLPARNEGLKSIIGSVTKESSQYLNTEAKKAWDNMQQQPSK